MSYQFLLVENTGGAAILTLNRPKANALSLNLMRELREAVLAAQADPSVHALIITGGEGKFFAAGADIPTLQGSLDDPLHEGGLLAEGLKTIDAIESCSKPVIAAVNGFALGGGCEVCLACHIRIAADSAVFGQPEILLGIIPGWGGTHRLPRIIGHGRATEWLLTGRQVLADEALDAGLVSRVVLPGELREAALKLVETLASKPAVATAETLRILRECALYPERGLAAEAEGFMRASRSADAAEGIAAYLEKRQPSFTGH